MDERYRGYASEQWCDLQRMVGYRAGLHPDKTAIKEPNGTTVSYAQLDALVDSLARGLSSLGLAKGDTIISALPDWHEAIAVFLAAAKMGLVLVPNNVISGRLEAEERLSMTNAKAVFAAREDVARFTMSVRPDCVVIAVRFSLAGCVPFEDVLDEGAFDPVPLDPENDTLVVAFTSGSTGEPKGIELVHRALFSSARDYGMAMRITSDDVFAMPMPVCHLFGLNAGVILPLSMGATILLTDNATPEWLLDLVESEKATVLYGVPTMFARALDVMKIDPRDTSSLRTGLIGGANCPEALVRDIRDILHCNVVVGYGSTEAGAVTATSMDDSVGRISRTVGRAFGDVEIRVIDASTGEWLKCGEGELVCTSPCEMKGYFKRPDLTASVMSDGWIHTGDAAVIDEDGYVCIRGRIDDMIIRGGYNIYGSELEHVYAECPDVVECCVTALPHDVLGQQTCIAVRLSQAASCTDPLELREFARGRIAKYKIPDHVVVFDELPHTPSGKVDVKKVEKECMRRVSDFGRNSDAVQERSVRPCTVKRSL